MYRYVHRPNTRNGRRKDLISIPVPGAWVEENDDGVDVHPQNLPAGAYLPEDDSQYRIDLPSEWEICGRCDGHGTHTNPNIDGNGISQDEWEGPDWDDESREMYRTGGFDVRCEAGCEGGKVLVVKEEALTADQRRVYEEWMRDESESAREGYDDARTRWYEDGCPQ